MGLAVASAVALLLLTIAAGTEAVLRDHAQLRLVIMRKYGWCTEVADTAITEYVRFLHLYAESSGESVVPSQTVDKVWHEHIAFDTESYAADCARLFGRFLHHRREREGESSSYVRFQTYTETLKLYERHFGSRPPDQVWGRRMTDQGRCPNKNPEPTIWPKVGDGGDAGFCPGFKSPTTTQEADKDTAEMSTPTASTASTITESGTSADTRASTRTTTVAWVTTGSRTGNLHQADQNNTWRVDGIVSSAGPCAFRALTTLAFAAMLAPRSVDL